MAPRVVSINAVTLATRDMAAAVRFYTALGFVKAYGGEAAAFTSFRVGDGHVNLIRAAPGASWNGWGRVILYVDDVDAMFAHARAQGFVPQAPPADATWGERYFHLVDPDGHELSFARPLLRVSGRDLPP
ncbi:MAG TPA: VOC family protein [Candidatus Methylomirabilis sp.]|nr:VOC family protein [Candidatus Methylomirabilis sp.]